MQSTYLRSALAVLTCLLVLVIGTPTSGWAQQPPTPPIPVPTAAAVSNGNLEESIPVVISYGEGQVARARISRGLMEPVGVPRQQAVTVTLFLPSAYAGQNVRLGLYDGGRAGTVPLPTQGISVNDPGVPLPVVLPDGTVQFFFQAGRTLGLYRLLVTVGASQYLLQFHAVNPSTG